MLPHGYTDDLPPDHDYLMKLGQLAVDEIKKTTGETYGVGTIPKLMYKVSGNAIDWTYDEVKVKVSFAVELRDTGTHGFLLPPEQIQPTATEVWNAMQVVFNNM